jgi:hypothetical protein
MKWTFVVAIAGLLASTLTSCDSSDPVVASEPTAEFALGKAKCAAQIVLDENVAIHFSGPSISNGPSYAGFKGTLTYNVTPSPILVRDMVSVTIDFDGILDSFDATDRVWAFSGKSTDQVALSISDPTYLVKAYHTPLASLQAAQMTLFVRYEISDCKVSVESIWAVEGGASILPDK